MKEPCSFSFSLSGPVEMTFIFCISNFATQEEASCAVFHKSSLWITLLIINYFAQHLCKVKMAYKSYNFTFFFFSSRLFITHFVPSKPCASLLPLPPSKVLPFFFFLSTPSSFTSPSCYVAQPGLLHNGSRVFLKVPAILIKLSMAFKP